MKQDIIEALKEIKDFAANGNKKKTYFNYWSIYRKIWFWFHGCLPSFSKGSTFSLENEEDERVEKTGKIKIRAKKNLDI